MNIINQFLEDPFLQDNENEAFTNDSHRLAEINESFSQHPYNKPTLHLLPSVKQNQIWSIKKEYLDYEGTLQINQVPMLVLSTTDPEYLDDDNGFIRVCPITPFVEMAADSDQVCDDLSILGFPFMIETWNEQPILLDLLDKFCGHYYADMTEQNDSLNMDQRKFRELEISRARFLNHSIIAYTNESDRAKAFSFTVDLCYSNAVKTKHMPRVNNMTPVFINLRDNEEYATAAKHGRVLSENDCIDFESEEMPIRIEVRKKSQKFVLTIIPKVEIQLISSDKKTINGTSNDERIVFDGLKSGLYIIILSDNKTISIRIR